MGEQEDKGPLYVAFKLCVNCKWYEHFEGVCCNGKSENRGAFMWKDGDTCDEWEMC